MLTIILFGQRSKSLELSQLGVLITNRIVVLSHLIGLF